MSASPSRAALSGLLAIALLAAAALAQAPAQSSSSAQRTTKLAKTNSLDPGSVSNNLYRNKSLGLTCKIPDGWVLRTDEMNARDEEDARTDPASQSSPPASSGGKVLLAAFSRPPAAKGEDVNSSIVIAAEPIASYPGLKDPAQYFGPLTEVASAQGFTVDADPYEIAIYAKTLVRADYHKDVGSRVMHQSTLAMLAHGYAISITLIAGTEDDVEDLLDGLSFTIAGKK